MVSLRLRLVNDVVGMIQLNRHSDGDGRAKRERSVLVITAWKAWTPTCLVFDIHCIGSSRLLLLGQAKVLLLSYRGKEPRALGNAKVHRVTPTWYRPCPKDYVAW
jgi:hypothetical protein